MTRTLLSLLLATVLAACAGARSVVPDRSTLSMVHEKLGSPTDIWFDQNGDEIWEYAGGPKGTETYVVRADDRGLVKAVSQVLTEAQFAKVIPGKMTKADVRHLLGRPSDQVFLHNGTSWTWRVNLRPETGYFVVHFDGKDMVLDKAIVVDASDGDGGKGDRGSSK